MTDITTLIEELQTWADTRPGWYGTEKIVRAADALEALQAEMREALHVLLRVVSERDVLQAENERLQAGGNPRTERVVLEGLAMIQEVEAERDALQAKNESLRADLAQWIARRADAKAERVRNAEGRFDVAKIERDRYSEAAERFKRERDALQAKNEELTREYERSESARLVALRGAQKVIAERDALQAKIDRALAKSQATTSASENVKNLWAVKRILSEPTTTEKGTDHD